MQFSGRIWRQAVWSGRLLQPQLDDGCLTVVLGREQTRELGLVCAAASSGREAPSSLDCEQAVGLTSKKLGRINQQRAKSIKYIYSCYKKIWEHPLLNGIFIVWLISKMVKCESHHSTLGASSNSQISDSSISASWKKFWS